jgi:hypothetical protein
LTNYDGNRRSEEKAVANVSPVGAPVFMPGSLSIFTILLIKMREIMFSGLFRDFALVSGVIALCGCGGDVPQTFAKQGLNCERDGFCVLVDDGEYFHGAFRDSEQELQFKVEPHGWVWTNLIAGGGSGTTACLMTEHQRELMQGSMTCGVDREDAYKFGPEEYREIAQKFDMYLQSTQPVGGRELEWKVLARLVHDFVRHLGG